MRVLTKKGFSLIEITMVLLIAALAAGAVTLRLQGPMHSARMQDVAERIATFDRLSRTYAREHDRPVLLVMDLNESRLTRTGEDDSGPLGSPLELPGGCAIRRLMVGRQDIAMGRLSIRISRRGLTPTYGLLLEGPAGRRQWLLLVGLTGQLVTVNDEDEARDILAATARRRDAG